MNTSNKHFIRPDRRYFRFKASSIIKAFIAAIILVFVIFAYELRSFTSMMRVENGSDVQMERLSLNGGQKTDLDVGDQKPAEKLEENVPVKQNPQIQHRMPHLMEKTLQSQHR